MEKTMTILGKTITEQDFPKLWEWAQKDREGLERRILSDLKPNEKASTLMIMLELDLEEQALK